MGFKTKEMWAIAVNYGFGKEIECYEFTRKEAREQLTDYRKNCAYASALISKHAKICPKCNLPMTEVTTDKGQFGIFEIKGTIQTYDCSQCQTSYDKKTGEAIIKEN